MDRLNKILILSLLSGIITLCIGTSYIPSIGGTVPPNKNPQEFYNEQQQAVYSSTGFKVTMIGTGISAFSLLVICIRSCIEDYRVEPEAQVKPEVKKKPILKVRRTAIIQEPHVEITVEDPKPQVSTTPNFGATAPPSSSPPPQLVPRGPVIEKIPLPNGIRKTFRYPPPYDVINR